MRGCRTTNYTLGKGLLLRESKGFLKPAKIRNSADTAKTMCCCGDVEETVTTRNNVVSREIESKERNSEGKGTNARLERL
jgi:hypothetical protein